MSQNCHRCRKKAIQGGGTERPLKGLATEALGEDGPKGRLMSGEDGPKGKLMSGKDCRKGLVIAPPS